MKDQKNASRAMFHTSEALLSPTGRESLVPAPELPGDWELHSFTTVPYPDGMVLHTFAWRRVGGRKPCACGALARRDGKCTGCGAPECT